jgi:hypothetical protein
MITSPEVALFMAVCIAGTELTLLVAAFKAPEINKIKDRQRQTITLLFL